MHPTWCATCVTTNTRNISQSFLQFMYSHSVPSQQSYYKGLHSVYVCFYNHVITLFCKCNVSWTGWDIPKIDTMLRRLVSARYVGSIHTSLILPYLFFFCLQATVMKKKMYYNMRVKTMKRNMADILRQLNKEKRSLTRGTKERLKALSYAIKEVSIHVPMYISHLYQCLWYMYTGCPRQSGTADFQ